MSLQKKQCQKCKGKGAIKIPYDKTKHSNAFVWPDKDGRPSYVLRECWGCANKGYVVAGGTCGVPLIKPKRLRKRKAAA